MSLKDEIETSAAVGVREDHDSFIGEGTRGNNKDLDKAYSAIEPARVGRPRAKTAVDVGELGSADNGVSDVEKKEVAKPARKPRASRARKPVGDTADKPAKSRASRARKAKPEDTVVADTLVSGEASATSGVSECSASSDAKKVTTPKSESKPRASRARKAPAVKKAAPNLTEQASGAVIERVSTDAAVGDNLVVEKPKRRQRTAKASPVKKETGAKSLSTEVATTVSQQAADRFSTPVKGKTDSDEKSKALKSDSIDALELKALEPSDIPMMSPSLGMLSQGAAAKPLKLPLQMRVSLAKQASRSDVKRAPALAVKSVDDKPVESKSSAFGQRASGVFLSSPSKPSLAQQSSSVSKTADIIDKTADEELVEELFASGFAEEVSALSLEPTKTPSDDGGGEPSVELEVDLLRSTTEKTDGSSWQQWVSAFIDAGFNRLSPPNDDNLDWQGDSHHAWLNQRPLRTRTLLYIFAATLLVMLVWSSLAKLDEVTRGNGKVIPSRQVQIIQSLDGGEVSEILVGEGDVVERDQLLVRLDKTRFMANYRESEVEREALEVKQERLRALTEKRDFNPDESLVEKVPNVVARERTLFQSVKAEWDAQKSIVDYQLRQREQELVEIQTRYQQLSRSYNLVNSEIEYSRPLVESGAVSKVEILRLERDANGLAGERDQAYAQISRVKSTIGEAQQKISQVDLDYLNNFRQELAEVTAKVSGMNEGESGLSDRVQKADIRSPVRGTIKQLHYNTLGGVVLPGKEVVEIVPLDDALLLEARIQPQDIAFLRPGQKAVVKFTAYDYAIYGGLDGVITHIGADTVKDEDGNPYYLVKVRTDKSKIGDDKPIIPGMVAGVDVITGKKSVLMYLLKPILRGKEYALRER